MTAIHFCPKCGADRQPGMRFCASCGYDYAATGEPVGEPAGTPSTPPAASQLPPPPPEGRSWGRIALIVIGVLVVLAIIVSLGQGGDNPEASPSQVAGGSQSEEPVDTPAPASVSAPTPTTGSAFAPINLTGTGDSVPTFAIPEDAVAVAEISHTGNSNFAVVALAADGSSNDLLVNVIGNYSGTVLFDESSGVHSVAFEVTADGAWTIQIRPVSATRTWDGSSALTGSGDDVVQINPQISGFVTAVIQYMGESNFAIIGYSSSGSDLMVNEIGPYSGEVPIESGTFLLEVTADGAWSIAPS